MKNDELMIQYLENIQHFIDNSVQEVITGDGVQGMIAGITTDSEGKPLEIVFLQYTKR